MHLSFFLTAYTPIHFFFLITPYASYYSLLPLTGALNKYVSP